MLAAMAAAAAAVVSAGCGVRPTGVLSAGGMPVANGRASTITVYLVKGGVIRPVVRPGLPGHPYLAIAQLGVPVTSVEGRAGLYSEVRVPLEGRIVDDPSVLIVDLKEGVPHRRVSWSRVALGQIACTAASIPGVERVKLWSGPDPDEYGWGFVDCAGFADVR
ncbi:hypothetical protein ACTIVE_8040 [Actinomadura verrucosospora]|uniref:Lipoprotein n=1 Tax=Actinomadura verrucosospora TaxID=46165 RepID=A0A7D4ABP7_ACTVE|nr:hypothetical protein ACTIVE_8040 [Actinomadura verrucosospora]